VKQQGFGGRDKMAAINRYGMKVYPSPFSSWHGISIPLITITITTPFGAGAVALTPLDFTRKQSKTERLLFFEEKKLNDMAAVMKK
jgi:hypothetical protein